MKLQVIDWRITSKCGMNCAFCYASEKVPRMNNENSLLVIKKLIESDCGTICISGGDPLLEGNYTIDIIKKLKESNKSIYLSTSGINFFSYNKDLEENIIKLSLPIDGFDEKSSESFGSRNSSCFARVDKILKYYLNYFVENKSLPFNIKISTVLTNKNKDIDFFKKIYEYLNQYKEIISLWKIYEFIPNDLTSDAHLIIKKDDFIEFKNELKKITKDFPYQIVSRTERSSAYLIIKANGDVFIPTDEEVMKEIIIGNIIYDDFDLIKERMKEYIDLNNYNNNAKLRNIRKGD